MSPVESDPSLASRPVIVVPHTHWDHEWYATSSTFLSRLVILIDDAITLLETDKRVSSILLDGQVSLVEEYLRIRPTRRPDVHALVRAHRLTIGPWYVQADELLASDETLVRNLAIARSVADDLGGCSTVGYCPDSFGHPAGLPTILTGFGISYAVLWRGYGGHHHPDGDLFRWTAPDGSSTLTHHLPPSGYEFGANLPVDPAGVNARWLDVVKTLVPRAQQRPLVLLNGADHHEIQPDIADAVEALRDASGAPVRIGNLDDYFRLVRDDPDVPAVIGELRDSYGYTWNLQGVHSTRQRIKHALAHNENLLVRWVEPQLALGRPDDTGYRAILVDAWKRHLLCCAHDSFGGCCSDDVAADVMARSRSVSATASQLLRDAIFHRLGFDRNAARRQPDKWRSVVVVVNPSPRARTENVHLALAFHVTHVQVGPGSEPIKGAESRHRAPVLRDSSGRTIPFQPTDRYTSYDRFDAPGAYPDQDIVDVVEGIAPVTVPALGMLVLYVDEGDEDVAIPSSTLTTKAGGLQSSVGSVTATRHGFRVETSNERIFHIGLEDDTDVGDTYTHQTAGDMLVPRWHDASVVWNGPFASVLGNSFRLASRCHGTVSVRMDASSSIVRYLIEGQNTDHGHRLRWRLDVPEVFFGDESIADMHFGPTVRTQVAQSEDHPVERRVATAPMHRYVLLGADEGNEYCVVFTKGLFEYERASRSLYVTLLRSVTELSRATLSARPGHAGWPVATPEAAELGAIHAEVGVSVFVAVDRDQAVIEAERLADQFHAPLGAVMVRQAISMPPQVRGPVLSGDGLSFRALKTAVDGNGTILRCVNVTARVVQGTWTFPNPVTRAVRVRLDETPVADLAVTDACQVSFSANPREVISVRVYR